MTSIIIGYEIMKDIFVSKYDSSEEFNIFCKIFANNYVIFHFLMMISFILRCCRIIECFKIKYDERNEIKKFIEKRHLFQEKYYIKILFTIMVIIIFINLIFTLQISENDMNLIPYHFSNCMSNEESGHFYVTLSWLVINFIEQIILLTYTYFLFMTQIKKLIKFELFAFMLVWIIYPNILRFSSLILNVGNSIESHWTAWTCCDFYWICLLLNGYLPIILSFYEKTSLIYQFNSKLANNLYLFLCNEICFYSFYDHIKSNEKDMYFLNMYTYITKYRLKFDTLSYTLLLEDSKEIYSKFFSSNSIQNYLEIEMTNKIKSKFHTLEINESSNDVFNEPLILAYNHLEELYKKYKRTTDYKILIDNLNLNSYIQCKMSNAGLISNF
jgi:hypothetical protein